MQDSVHLTSPVPSEGLQTALSAQAPPPASCTLHDCELVGACYAEAMGCAERCDRVGALRQKQWPEPRE